MHVVSKRKKKSAQQTGASIELPWPLIQTANLMIKKTFVILDQIPTMIPVLHKKLIFMKKQQSESFFMNKGGVAAVVKEEEEAREAGEVPEGLGLVEVKGQREVDLKDVAHDTKSYRIKILISQHKKYRQNRRDPSLWKLCPKLGKKLVSILNEKPDLRKLSCTPSSSEHILIG